MARKKNYTLVNNSLFEGLSKLEGLTGSDMRVLICILRNTICYHTNEWFMSLSYLQKGTNLSRRQTQRSLEKLSNSELIEITPAHGTVSRKIKVRVDKIGFQGGQNWLARVDNSGKKMTSSDHQETKEEIKDKENKEKEKATASFSLDEDDKELTEEELEALWDSLGEE